MCNLLSCQLVRLKTCLQSGFPEERLPCSRDSLDVAKKNGQTNLIPISGRVPVLNLEFAHGRSEFQPTVEKLPKGCHGSGGFLRWIFGGKKHKKNPPKKSTGESASRKQRIRRRMTPESTSQAQKSAAKPTNKSACQTSRISGALFGCLPGMVEAPTLKCTCNPSAAAGGRDKVCCAPFETTLIVKNVLRKRPKNNKNNPPHDSANSSSPTVVF